MKESNVNILICTYGTGIGGMEVFFANYAKYLISNQYSVYFVTQDSTLNIYDKLLKEEKDRIHFARYAPNNILYMSEKEREQQRKNVLIQLKDINWNHAYAVGGYFSDMMLMMSLFREKKIPLTHIWSHPLGWVGYSFLQKNKYHYKKRKRSSVFYYQKTLLESMDINMSSYYTSYAIFNYNSWYYEVNLRKRTIEGLPIQTNIGAPFNYRYNQNTNELKVLWVGRFDYFKNDAIIYISNTLDRIAKEKKIKISFTVVGKGSPKYESELRNKLKSKHIKIEIQGVIQPEFLNSIFAKMDIGIGMGVTVKQMGFAGLPAILIDSRDRDYKEEKCCNWVFDIETGDDGDGMYYYYIGHPLSYRKSLYNVLLEVVDEPSKLSEFSSKCKSFVSKNYSYDRQYGIITERVVNSTFTGEGFEIYRYGFVRRLLRKIVRLSRTFKIH
mgnify:CR=1 FL=1